LIDNPRKDYTPLVYSGRTALRKEQCGVAPRDRSKERPLLINGYAYLGVSLPDNGHVGSNS
jgi:hypothetical protein